MAKVPMLTGIWGSLPNLKSGGSAELPTSFLLGVRLGLEGSEGGPVSCSSTPRGRLPPCSWADQSGGLCCVPDTSMERTAGLGWGDTHSTVVMAELVVTVQSLSPGVGASAGVIPPPRLTRSSPSAR